MLRIHRRRRSEIARAGLAGCLAAGFVLMAGPTSARAQEEPVEQRVERLEDEVREIRSALERLRQEGARTPGVERLRAQIEALTRELERIRLGRDVVATADTSVLGFGPAASKIYKTDEGVSIGGYGEIVYQNYAGTREDGSSSGKTDRIDALRGIVYVGYRFSDDLLFNSEIEFEHGSTSGGVGSASLEFAYLDYRFSENVGARAGLLLAPMGFVNELHEPPVFLGVNRPRVEQAIIPTTWRENGIGLFGSAGDLEYRAYLMNGFDAIGGGSSPAGGYSASGLRGGRQKGAKALAEDFAGVGRLDYVGTPGLRVGTSLYLGEAGQGRTTPGGVEIDARTLIWEGHAEYRARGLDLRGLAVVATVDDVAAVNLARGLTGAASVGERLTGWYLQVGYDLLHRADPEDQLTPYVRYEALDTQAEVPDGYQRDPATDRSLVVVGAQWKPVPSAVLKADYEIQMNDAETGVNQFNVAVGYLF